MQIGERREIHHRRMHGCGKQKALKQNKCRVMFFCMELPLTQSG